MDLDPECRELGMHKRNKHVCDQESHTSSPVCEKCRYIFNNWSPATDEYNESHPYAEWRHWENVLAFKYAASKGCHLCILFLSQFKESEIEDAEGAMRNDKMDALSVLAQAEPIIESASRRSGQGCWSLTMTLPLSDGPALSVLGMSPSFVALEPYADFSTSTMAKPVLQMAKSWFGDCIRSHSACRPSQHGPNPTRLIQVGADGPRLILSAGICGPISYATLSHCWGSLKILRLVKSNFSQLQQKIPLDGLCQTFQDACKITEELGIRYLWIDSLCIIQDDPDDWNREALQMAVVYGRSSINISASKATDGSMGLFASRNPKSVEVLQICLDWMKWDTFPEALDPLGDICKGTLYDCAPLFMHKKCISESPLGKRAWVLQERILSCRSLHFSSQLFWECKERTACETFPGWLPGIFRWKDGDIEAEGNLEHWFAIVWLYTRCKLTFTKDKFIAISGVAKSLQERYSDEYVAGFWRKDLERQLLWYSHRPTARPSPPRAPSWSWISTDSAVHSYSGAKYLPYLIKVLHIKIIPAGDSVFGDLRQGALWIRCGCLIPFTLGSKPTSINNHRQIFSGGRMFSISLVFMWDYIDAEEYSGQLYLLSACRNNASGWHWGYVLEPTSLEKGQYRRLGTFDSVSNVKETVEQRLELENSPQCKAPDSAYDELVPDDEFGKKQFVITLI